MKPVKDDMFELSTGKQFYAHGLVLSVGRHNGGWELGYGADGSISMVEFYPEPRAVFTADELMEIARHQIDQWRDFIKDIPSILAEVEK